MATGIERFNFMIGDWDIQAYNMGEDGEWVESPMPKETTIESMANGAFLREDVVPMLVGDQQVNFFIMWGYDKFRDVYRMLAADDTEGLMDILEGNFKPDSDTIVVSNQSTGTCISDEHGNQVFLRLTSSKENEDCFIDEMHESYDGGKVWMPVYRAVHQRKK